jgi:hypothetical protein
MNFKSEILLSGQYHIDTTERTGQLEKSFSSVWQRHIGQPTSLSGRLLLPPYLQLSVERVWAICSGGMLPDCVGSLVHVA